MRTDPLLYEIVELFYEAIPTDRLPHSTTLLRVVELLDEVSVHKVGLHQARPRLQLFGAELHLAVRRREVPADLVSVYTALRDTVRAVCHGYLTGHDVDSVKSLLAEAPDAQH